MSKYNQLWEYIKKANQDELLLNFSQVKDICGFEIDHSFLNYKKELLEYGFEIKKISLKNKTVLIVKNKV